MNPNPPAFRGDRALVWRLEEVTQAVECLIGVDENDHIQVRLVCNSGRLQFSRMFASVAAALAWATGCEESFLRDGWRGVDDSR
jgi:hypothetical protein